MEVEVEIEVEDKSGACAQIRIQYIDKTTMTKESR